MFGIRLDVTTLTFSGILAAAMAARLLPLRAKTFWFDEWYSIAVVRLDGPRFFALLTRREGNMALYYLLLRFWVRFGNSEVFIRMFSILCGLATLPLFYLLVSRMFGKRAGLVGAFLLALNAFHVQYSLEARSYSLLVLLVTLASFLFVKCIEQPTIRHWSFYTLASVLAIYSHFFAFLLIPVQWASLLFLPRRQIPWIGMVVSNLLVGFATLPLALLALRVGPGPVSWLEKPGVLSVFVLFYHLAGSRGVPMLLLAYLVLCVAAILPSLRRWSSCGRSMETWRLGFATLWLLVPILVALAVSIKATIFLDRFLIICLPALILLVAKGVSGLQHKWLFAATCTVLAVLAAYGVIFYSRDPNREELGRQDWKGASEYILSNAWPGDSIIFHQPFSRLPYDYYLGQALTSGPLPAVVYPVDWTQAQLKRTTQAGPSETEIAALRLRYDRVWLFLSYAQSPDWSRMQRALSNQYTLLSERAFRGGSRVLLYGKSATTGSPGPFSGRAQQKRNAETEVSTH